MYVSAEVITLVISAVSVALTVLGGTRAIVALSEKKIETRFDKVDSRFDKVDARFDKLDGELHEIRRDIGDVKERVARLEGPRAQLQLR